MRDFLEIKCDYRTDWHTDAEQSDPYVPLCLAGNTKMTEFSNKYLFYISFPALLANNTLI